MSLLLRAAQFATAAHGNQRRKYTNALYITHPARVSARALRLREGSEELGAAGYLHDVAEDCYDDPRQGVAEIRDRFGDYVARIVGELTQPPKTVGNREYRKNLYHDLLRNGSREARLLKLLDRIDNLHEMGPDDFMRVYLKETRHLLDAIGFTDDDLAHELVVLSDQIHRKLRG
jgi:(p)ppGpp synthase/HD superfamily hydrolase